MRLALLSLVLMLGVGWELASSTLSSSAVNSGKSSVQSTPSSAKRASKNKGFEPGVVLGKDRELFHIVLDLRWVISKLKNYRTWLNLARRTADIVGTTAQRFNLVRYWRHNRYKALTRDLAINLDLYSRLYEENPTATVNFFGGTVWQALDYARRKSRFLIVYVEREKDRVRVEELATTTLSGDSDAAKAVVPRGTRGYDMYREDGGPVGRAAGSAENPQGPSSDGSSTGAGGDMDMPESLDNDVSTSALCRRALADARFGEYVNSQFVFFGGQTASPSTRRLLRRLGAKEYPYLALLHVPPQHRVEYESPDLPLNSQSDENVERAAGTRAPSERDRERDKVKDTERDKEKEKGKDKASGGDGVKAGDKEDHSVMDEGELSGKDGACSWTFSRKLSEIPDRSGPDSRPEILGTLKIGPDIKTDKIQCFLMRAQELYGEKLVKNKVTTQTHRTKRKR